MGAIRTWLVNVRFFLHEAVTGPERISFTIRGCFGVCGHNPSLRRQTRSSEEADEFEVFAVFIAGVNFWPLY